MCGITAPVGCVIFAEMRTAPSSSVNFAALWSRFDRI